MPKAADAGQEVEVVVQHQEIVVESLAVKYRPQSFYDMVGNQDCIESIVSHLQSGTWPAAILISGKYGTGKTTLSRLIAKSINCYDFDFENLMPCGRCTSCTEFDSPGYPAYEEINCGTDGGVDEVRRMVKEMKFEIRFRVRIFNLDEAHELTKKAINSLLKPAEESGGNNMWIFTTTHPEKLQEILGSRCLPINLKPVKAEEIGGRLIEITEAEGFTIADETAMEIAECAGGSVREGIRLLESAKSRVTEGSEITIEEATGALDSLDLELDKAVVAFLVMLYNPGKQFPDRIESMLVALAEIGNDEMAAALNKMEDINCYVIYFVNNWFLGKEDKIKNPNWYNPAVKLVCDELFEHLKKPAERSRIRDVAMKLADRLCEAKERAYSPASRNLMATAIGTLVSRGEFE